MQLLELRHQKSTKLKDLTQQNKECASSRSTSKMLIPIKFLVLFASTDLRQIHKLNLIYVKSLLLKWEHLMSKLRNIGQRVVKVLSILQMLSKEHVSKQKKSIILNSFMIQISQLKINLELLHEVTEQMILKSWKKLKLKQRISQNVDLISSLFAWQRHNIL